MNREPPAVVRAEHSTIASRAIWSGLDAVANPLSMLVMLAGLVRFLGAADYGVLAMSLAASGISLAINPAIATTTTRFVSEALGRGGTNRESAAGLITAALVAVLVIDLVLIGGTALARVPLANALYGRSIEFAHREAVLLLAMGAVALQQLDTVIAAAIRGAERFKVQALLEICLRCTLTGITLMVAWSTASVVQVLAAQCAVFATFALVRGLALRALLPERRLLIRVKASELVRLLRYGGWMWLTAIAGVAYASADRIIVGRSLGAVAAGEYSVFVQITQLIHFLPSNLIAFALPGFSRLSVDGTPAGQLAATYRTYFRSACIGAFGLTLLLLLGWPYVLQVFVAGRIESSLPSPAVILLAVNFLLLATNVVPYYLLLALGGSRQVSVTVSASMSVALILMAVLIPRYGLVGAAAARLAYGVGALRLIGAANRLLYARQ